MNNINQSRTNFPIVCKNNVIKSSRFCVLSNKPPPLLVNGRLVEQNTVLNLGSATRLIQSNVNTPSTVQSTVNIHNNSVQSNGNGEINEISDDEVICLDDDDDDDDDDNNHHNDNNNNGNGNNNNDDGNNLQGLEHSINPLNQWVPSQPRVRHTNNTNNNVTTNIYNSYKQKKYKQKTKKLLKLKKKVVYLRNNAPSTNIPPAVEMTVTPDMPMSTSDMDSPLNQEVECIDLDSEPTESLLVEPEPQPQPDPVPEPGPSRVLPDTGFHFLFSTDETVDLTTKEDNTPKKRKPIIRQKKTPKPRKAVASKKQTRKTSIAQQNPKNESKILRSSTSSTIEKKQTRKTSIAESNLRSKGQLLRSSISPNAEQLDTSLTKPRPKRASAIDSAAVIKNSGLYKLGKCIEGRSGNWSIKMTSISLPMFQCPICHKFFYSLKSRQEHETSKHSSLLESIHEPANIVSSPGNSACTQQLYLFNYLQLCQTSKNKTETVHQLAKRRHLLKAFNSLRNKIIGLFQCTYCPFDTNLIFACWAHMTSSHLNCVFEKRSCLFCFVCSRILTKRTTMLKHLDGCVIKHYTLPINNSCVRFMCVHCDDSFDSLIELDDHTWEHEDRYNY
ncbi:PREDICTED: hybrid signal transduction histidine kinase G-like isoform X2 [Diuraphis noxia]|uniref:hybrid signal transduction histidine kinase G-like isoform X2 n=1 Tax=Diuraphis noxia TaxID=143948 RepID=UPI0007638C0F|nr:PREDICTED: hybrid signal transduction histidine kinase G-like isoform X2 [Diuraphis noxia]